MNIRLRTLNEVEAAEAQYDGRPVISLVVPAEPADSVLNRFAVLEYQYGEGSAEGPSWTPVEVC